MTTPDDLCEYAATLLLEHTRDIESLSIYEMAEEHLGREITDGERETVEQLLAEATITIDWPEESR